MLVLTSCDKTPINGPLDGMWQLMSVETPAGVVDTKAEHAYISFQLHTSQWNHANDRLYSAFRHSGDSLFFDRFRHLSLHRTAADDDEPVTTDELADGLMDAWGIHTTSARFKVVRLTNEHLTLNRADTTLMLRKF